MHITNIYQALKSAPTDPAVGIKVVRMTGDDSFSLFGAEIAARRKVGAHYHHKGIETYQIIEGRGRIHLGKPGEGGSVTWEDPVTVIAGDCFTVKEGQVHQLENTEDSRLVAVFGCPTSHLGEDRTLVEGRY